MTKSVTIDIDNAVACKQEWRLRAPVSLTVNADERVAIVGRNGGGKTMLVEMLTGSHAVASDAIHYDFTPSESTLVSDNIKYITFRDSYGEGDRTFYLQLRWNQIEIDEETPTVRELLEKAYSMTGGDTPDRRAFLNHLIGLLGLTALLDKYIILLSSGELRKFQMVRALLKKPRILIIDNPFIGLDADARHLLKELLRTLSLRQALQIIIVLSKTDDIPDFITHVVEVRDMVVQPKVTLAEYLSKGIDYGDGLTEEKVRTILSLPDKDDDYNCEEVIRMRDVCIRYGERTILDRLSWTVRNGERWSLSGRNGAGKSTLLSLICADNPQGYACDIALFGRERGSGESIWDIKKHIGYVSPEMHRAYRRNLPAIQIVASGLRDSVGLYVRPNEEEYGRCRMWMDIFGLEGLEDAPFLKLSSGEQRLVLLARAFVKDPELLILDEPLHGLDDANRRMVKDIINTFCRRRNKTLIMVTHYAEELPKCIDNHMVLKGQ